MKQWVVHAWDGTDEGALARRLAIRDNHLAGARGLKATGNFVLGGAMLDDDGNMIGSTMIVQFETVEERDAWIAREPYIQDGVWEDWKIYPFRVADV
ncbi:MAG: hypothetical protein JST12_13810 [Armatimonadetes bacterium]|nr:hypothetical protein [Armatimonadota bacterium]